MQCCRFAFPLLTAVSALLLAERGQAAQLEVRQTSGEILKDNPLGDPSRRTVAVFSPEHAGEAKVALVIYLPGWGSTAQNYLNADSFPARVVDHLSQQGVQVRLAVVDGRSRYGGSQFVNSTATGRYADFITQEVLPMLRQQYEHGEAAPCLIAGHSSGGYGALILAMQNHDLFKGVAALSPDSDFETTHRPLVQNAAVKAVTSAELEECMAAAGRFRLPENGLARLVLGLSANYTATPGRAGKFDWLYDGGGNWQPQVWARWMAADPLTIVQTRADAFADDQRIYLDGAEHDEFGANIGARKIYEVLKERRAPSTFREPAGGHGEHLEERLAEGLRWIWPTKG